MKTNITKALEMQATIKEKHGNDVLTLFRTADWYELYGKDALALYVCSDITAQNANDANFGYIKQIQNKIEVMTERVRFKFSRLDEFLPKIIRAGHRVCIMDAPVEYTTTTHVKR